jgi:hypothetical protein
MCLGHVGELDTVTGPYGQERDKCSSCCTAVVPLQEGAQVSGRFWGPSSFLSKGYRGDEFAGGLKRPERDSDHSFPSSAEVNF